jgi:prevent-host-death family protein
VSEAQSRLPRILKEAEEGEPVCIRRHNEPVAYIVSRARMEAIVETMEILADEEAMRAIQAHRAKKTKFVTLASLDE